MDQRLKKIHFEKVFDTLVIAFAIVLFWRGVWGLMDLYLFPSNHAVSYVISIVLGVAILYTTKNLVKNLV